MASKDADEPSESPAERFWKDFITESPYIDGNAQPWSLPQDIPWFDKDRYNGGHRFLNEYFALQAFFIFLGNILGAAAKPIVGVFFRDNQLYPENVWFERSLKGIKFWLSWNFENDMTDIQGQGTKEFRITRGIHAKYAGGVDSRKHLLPLPDHLIPKECHEKAKEIRELFQDVHTPDVPPELVSYYPPLPFSQFAASFAAFGVWAPFWTMTVVRNNLQDEEGLSNFMHHLALVARRIGVMDKHNFALYPDLALYEKGMNLSFVVLKEIDATGYFIMQPSLKILSRVGMTPNVMFHLAAEQAGVDCKKLWDRMSWMEKAVVNLNNKGLYFYMKFRPFRIMMNVLAKIVFKLLFFIYLKGNRDSRKIRKVNANNAYYQ